MALFEGKAEFLKKRPVRDFLKEREPLIPRKKIVDVLNLDSPVMGQEIALPPDVTPEAAIEVVSRTAWARGLAEGD